MNCPRDHSLDEFQVDHFSESFRRFPKLVLEFLVWYRIKYPDEKNFINDHSFASIIEKSRGLYRINQYKPRVNTNQQYELCNLAADSSLLRLPIQTNIIKVHHTCTASNRAKTKSNRIDICKIRTKCLKVDIPFGPSSCLCCLRIIIIDFGVAVEGNIQSLSSISWFALVVFFAYWYSASGSATINCWFIA